MKKIKTYAVVSLDGFTARIDGDIDWKMPFTKGRDYGMSDFLQTVDCALFNRDQYVLWQSYDLALPLGQLPCYVITNEVFTYPDDLVFKIILDKGDKRLSFLPQVQEVLQSGEGGIFLAGDQQLVSVFNELDAIDEINLVVLPVTLGAGQPFIQSNSNENRWTLTDHQVYDNGVVRLRYEKQPKD